MRKIIWVSIVILLIGNCYCSYKIYDLSEDISYLGDENNNLENRVETLGITIEQLKTQLEDFYLKNTNAQESTTASNLKPEQIDISNNLNPTVNSVSKNIKNSLSLNLPLSMQTIYFDSGRLISPTLENLHYLFSINDNTFVNQMERNSYSLSTTTENYVNNSTKNCCYTIDKDIQSVTMLFTKSVDNNIEQTLNNNNIDYVYEDGYKKYTYIFNNSRFELYIQSAPRKLILLLKNI